MNAIAVGGCQRARIAMVDDNNLDIIAIVDCCCCVLFRRGVMGGRESEIRKWPWRMEKDGEEVRGRESGEITSSRVVTLPPNHCHESTPCLPPNHCHAEAQSVFESSLSRQIDATWILLVESSGSLPPT